MVQLVESGVDPIYRYYYGSAKRRRQVNAIADVIDEDPVYFSGPSGTRWMASRLRAYTAVKKHYNVVVMHMEDTTNTRGEDGARCQGYLRVLKARQFLDALAFMIDVLQILSHLSLAMQKDTLLVTDVTVELNIAHLKLTAMKKHKGEVFREVQEDIEQDTMTYRNIKLSGCALSEDAMNTFLDDCMHFMRHRFAHLSATPFAEFAVFDVGNHPRCMGDLGEYGIEDITVLTQFFSSVLSDDEKVKIPEEWTSLKAVMMSKRRMKSHELITELLAENRPELQCVLILIKIMVTLSPSSAAVERGFSKMKAIKTARKARMTNSTLSSMMTVNHMDVSLKDFDPMPAVYKWMSMTKRGRSIKYRKAVRGPPSTEGAVSRNTNADDSDDSGPALPMMLDDLAKPSSPGKPDGENYEIDYSSSGSEFEGFWTYSIASWTSILRWIL